MDKTRCPSCNAEYFATEFECPACGARNPAFNKPAAPAPPPPSVAPARGGALGVVGIVLLLLACVVGGGLLLRGDLKQDKQQEDLLAELNGAFSGVSLGGGYGSNDPGLVADDLEIKGPLNPNGSMAFEGYLDGADGRAGTLSGTWDRPKGRITYSFHGEVNADGRMKTVTGEGEVHIQKHGPSTSRSDSRIN